jgi:L-2-hydroxyglutarate oxidase LhgO
VIGAGVIGCTVAWRIRQSLGFEVDLYERRDDILLETSAGTSNRFHRGYQYARSAETAVRLRGYQQRFEQLSGRCVVPSAN